MIVGTAGHIDHGKTSLVRALTGVDTDRLKEEKARGISIELGFAYLPAADGSVIGFVDVPGHEKFIRTMLAGAAGIDFALLVVAADDGVMPQTREHVAILDLLGVEKGVVAMTKCDLVPEPQRAEVELQILELLARTRLANAEVISISSVTGDGIETLRRRLLQASPQFAGHPSSARFRLAVDRCFSLTGIGTVVTGTVLSGEIRIGDRVLISPSGREARVRSIHAQDRLADRGLAGERCALNLAGEGIGKTAIVRGDIVLDPALHAPTERIDALLRILPSEKKAITQWLPVRLHHAASDVGARIVLLGDAPLDPGAEGFVQLVLERPIAAAVADRFVVRDTTAQRTLGGGRFVDIRAPARKRRTAERRAQLEACAVIAPEGALPALLARAPYFVDLLSFARDRALSARQVAECADRLGLVRAVVPGAEFVVAPAVWTRLRDNLLSTLEDFHREHPDLPGIGLERLRLQSEPRLPATAFRSFIQADALATEITVEGAWVRLAGHQVRLTPADENLSTCVLPLLAGAERFRPPRVRDIAKMLAVEEKNVRRLLKLLARTGKVDEVAHDHFFLRETVAEMVDIIADLAQSGENGQFAAAQLRDRLQNGRKVAIQILEFFDSHGVTFRRGDLRRINKHRVDLFPPTRVRPSDQTITSGRETSPVGRPDFKSGKGREPVLGGFDSLSLPPSIKSPA
jgi:selenocysteine-specific elongation factor